MNDILKPPPALASMSPENVYRAFLDADATGQVDATKRIHRKGSQLPHERILASGATHVRLPASSVRHIVRSRTSVRGLPPQNELNNSSVNVGQKFSRQQRWLGL